MTSLHKDLPVGEIHVPYSWEYDNATERTSASGFVAADVGKLAWQHDDNSIWLLSSITPTWVQVGGVASGTDAALLYLEARKGSGGSIPVGKPVYQSGYNLGGWVEVELADADDPSKMPCIGLTKESIGTGSTAKVVVAGRLSGFSTSAWLEGDPLYVDVTAGGLTNVKPYGASTGIQKVGSVLYTHVSQGVVFVSGANRTNDLPNLTEGKGWVGDANGQPIETQLSLYGQDYDFQVSESRSTTTLSTWPSKVSITVPANNGVKYGIDFTCKVDAGNKLAGVRLYNVTDTTVLDESQVKPASADQVFPVNGFVEIIAGEATKQVDLQWRTPASDTIGIQQARLKLRRVA